MGITPDDLTAPSDTDTAEKARRRKAPLLQTDVPTFPIAQAMRVPRALVERLEKKPSSPLQVAAAMGLKPTTGDFRTLTGASAAFGLTEGGSNAGQIKLTDLGRRLLAPLEEGDDRVALREAVMLPRINKAFFERNSGKKWPREDIASNVLEELGVPADQTKRALQRLREDAESAGFLLDINGDTYIQLDGPPPTGDVAAADAPAPTAPATPTVGMPMAVSPIALRDGTQAPPTSALAVVALPEPENRKVFITHGKDVAIVQQIKEILTFGQFEPVVAAENQTSAKPVPDKVMDDMRSCAAGIVHVGSEMKLLDSGGNEHQMLNPNVLIEIGAAMALYGRRFILLVERGTTLPSNLQGLYEVRYEGKGLDHEATMNLLKAFNSFKDVEGGKAA